MPRYACVLPRDHAIFWSVDVRAYRAEGVTLSSRSSPARTRRMWFRSA